VQVQVQEQARVWQPLSRRAQGLVRLQRDARLSPWSYPASFAATALRLTLQTSTQTVPVSAAQNGMSTCLSVKTL
jgi:hypothetical protein